MIKEEEEYRFVMGKRNFEDELKIVSAPKDNERGYFLRPTDKKNNPFVNPIPTITSEKFKKDFIAEIWIGPACNKQQARYEVESILEKNGYEEGQIIIYDSDIPYRSKSCVP